MKKSNIKKFVKIAKYKRNDYKEFKDSKIDMKSDKQINNQKTNNQKGGGKG